MADQPNLPAQPPAPAAPPATPPPANGETAPGPVPYDRFKQINDERNELERRLKAIEAKLKTDEESALTEQKKWQELATKREGELKQERLERLRLTVATANGLPVEFAGRLMGETEDELKADALRLKEFIKPREGPGVPPALPGGQPPKLDLTRMTPKEIREKKAVLLQQR